MNRRAKKRRIKYAGEGTLYPHSRRIQWQLQEPLTEMSIGMSGMNVKIGESPKKRNDTVAIAGEIG